MSMEEESTQNPSAVAERLRGIADALDEGTLVFGGQTISLPERVHFKLELEEAGDDDESEYEIEVEITWPVPMAQHTEGGAGWEDDETLVLYYEAQVLKRTVAARHLRALAAGIWSEQFKLGEHAIDLPPELTLDIEIEDETPEDEADTEKITKLEIEIGWDSWSLMGPSGLIDSEDDEDKD